MTQWAGSREHEIDSGTRAGRGSRAAGWVWNSNVWAQIDDVGIEPQNLRYRWLPKRVDGSRMAKERPNLSQPKRRPGPSQPFRYKVVPRYFRRPMEQQPRRRDHSPGRCQGGAKCAVQLGDGSRGKEARVAATRMRGRTLKVDATRLWVDGFRQICVCVWKVRRDTGLSFHFLMCRLAVFESTGRDRLDRQTGNSISDLAMPILAFLIGNPACQGAGVEFAMCADHWQTITDIVARRREDSHRFSPTNISVCGTCRSPFVDLQACDPAAFLLPHPTRACAALMSNRNWVDAPRHRNSICLHYSRRSSQLSAPWLVFALPTTIPPEAPRQTG